MNSMEYPFYVINEYEILKRIFSNLSNKDLVATSRVCREWRKLAQKMIAESARPCCYFKESNYWSEPLQKDLKLQPKLIIHMASQLKKKYQSKKTFIQLFTDVDSFLRKIYNLDKAAILSVQNWKYITCSDKDGALKIIHDNDEDPKESLILIPEIGDLKIHVNCLTGRTDYPAAIDRVKQSKCCIFLTGSKRNYFDLANSFLITFDQSEELLLVGGIAEKIYFKSGLFLAEIPVVIISFLGESVSAFIDILDDSKDIGTFFVQMTEKVGPLPDGFMRIAFIFSCVNRYHIYEELETKEFSKFFPNVPIYGFWSLGEFYFKGPNLKRRHCEGDKKPRLPKHLSREQFFHQEVTSYLILTFKK